VIRRIGFGFVWLFLPIGCFSESGPHHHHFPPAEQDHPAVKPASQSSITTENKCGYRTSEVKVGELVVLVDDVDI
jgi:hypothetical protein